MPSLGDLESQFPARLKVSFDKALAELDEFRESMGKKPTVNVSLRAAGREIDSEQELARFLDELREQITKDLQAGHRVRLS